VKTTFAAKSSLDIEWGCPFTGQKTLFGWKQRERYARWFFTSNFFLIEAVMIRDEVFIFRRRPSR
jgi:hypothetical protein